MHFFFGALRVKFNSLHAGQYCMLFCHLLIFFLQIYFFQKFFHLGLPPESPTFWTKIRSDIMLDLIWVQTVCKGYQQTASHHQQTELKCIKLQKKNFYQNANKQANLIFLPRYVKTHAALYTNKEQTNYG